MEELAKEYLKQAHLGFLKRAKNKEIYEKIVNATNYLPKNSEVRQRLFHIVNHLDSIVLCKGCGINPVSWNKHQYLEYCSSQCSNNSKTVKDKKIETVIKNYGVDNPFKSEIIIEKIQETNLERYGHVCNLHGSQKEMIEKIFLENYGNKIPTSSPIIREKINKTFEERFGGSCPLKSEKVKEKLKNTVTERYGVDHISKLPEVKQKIINSNMERYGVECSLQSEEVKEKIKSTNLEKYGVENERQKHISPETLKNLDNKDFLINEHHTNKKPLIIIAKELMVSDTTVYNYCRKHNVSIKQFYQSSGEKQICDYLTSLNINFLPRHLLNGVEVDIFIPEHSLAIEYNGLYWHSEENGKDRNYHKNKTLHCNSLRIRLLHIFEDEWLEHSEIIKTKLSILLNKYSLGRIFARKCKIVINPDCKEFLEKYHIQGFINSKTNIGLMFNEELVAIMCFIESSQGIWDLRRFASSKMIVGGFSKILSYFKENYSWTKIISFADLRMSDGNLYEKNGFILDKTIRQDYEYVYNGKRIHKFNFRHKRLAKILENYDPNLSEYQNCLNNGIYRIWDVGKIRYKIEKKGLIIMLSNPF